jgi:hypothetical protein
MKNVILRSSMVCAAAAMLAAGASPLAAQARDKEIRLDFASLSTSDGRTQVGVGYPGTFALGIYMNENLAIEPQIGLTYVNDNDTDESSGVINAGLFAPWYFNGDAGRTGLFVSPGITVTKGFGDNDFDALFDYGLDLGVKLGRSDRVSTRLALTLRDGDTFNDPALGAVFGVGMFWR